MLAGTPVIVNTNSGGTVTWATLEEARAGIVTDKAIAPSTLLAWGPNNTTLQVDLGGNARGVSAIDLQVTRANATEVASGDYSFIAGGVENTASGNYSYAEGQYCVAAGNTTHAEGYDTDTTAGSYYGAHAEGCDTISGGRATHAEGEGGEAVGDSAHAEGLDTYAIGAYSHAEGGGGKAWVQGQHSECGGSGYGQFFTVKMDRQTGPSSGAIAMEPYLDLGTPVGYDTLWGGTSHPGCFINALLFLTAGAKDGDYIIAKRELVIKLDASHNASILSSGTIGTDVIVGTAAWEWSIGATTDTIKITVNGKTSTVNWHATWLCGMAVMCI